MNTQTNTSQQSDLLFFLLDSNETIYTDAFKARVLCQFLKRFREEFTTELEFRETIEQVLNETLLQSS